MGVGEHFRPRLQRELVESRKAQATLSGDIATTSELRHGSNVDDEHDPEGSTIAYELSQSATLLRDARARIAEVEAALTRLDDGRYGRCEVCGSPIAEGRLEARPWTRFCIDHAAGR